MGKSPLMTVSTLPLFELTPALAGRWASFLDRRPELAGPCFRPEFFRVIGRHVPNALVAHWKDGADEGFVPFTRVSGSDVAGAIPMCDYQFVASPPGARWNPKEWLEGAGLAAWDFDYLVGPQVLAVPERYGEARDSLRVTLRGSASSYFDDRRAQGASGRNLKAKQRRIERDVGPLKITARSSDDSALDDILAWKTRRFAAGPTEFSPRRLFADLLAETGPVTGVLSTLHAGPRLVAAHFGVAATGILYYWIGAFDPDFSRYTPGWMLVQKLIESLPELGCRSLDFGPGNESYKHYFANDKLPCRGGSYERATPFTLWRRFRRSTRRAVRPVARGCRRLLRKDAA